MSQNFTPLMKSKHLRFKVQLSLEESNTQIIELLAIVGNMADKKKGILTSLLKPIITLISNLI